MQRATIDIDASLIDQLMVICLYRDWKDASAEVSAAYSRSSDAGPTDRTLADFGAKRSPNRRDGITVMQPRSSPVSLPGGDAPPSDCAGVAHR
jgi:hypothetical protein